MIEELRRLYPADEYELLQIVVPVPRATVEMWSPAQKQDVQQRANRAVLDVLAKET